MNGPMTGQQDLSVESAVNILNEVRHADCNGWHRRGDIVEPGSNTIRLFA